MDYKNLREHKIEELLKEVPGSSEGQTRSLMAVVGRCTIEVGDRLCELTGELGKFRSELAAASEASSKQSGALIRWSKVLAFVTFLYTLITAGLLLVALLGSPLR